MQYGINEEYISQDVDRTILGIWCLSGEDCQAGMAEVSMDHEETAAYGLCHDQVSSLDRDRYLVAMAAPRQYRHHLMALYAFNVEVAGISETVSETMVGKIRLQWWRECIDCAVAGGPRPAGIAGCLHHTIIHKALSPVLFHGLLEARERDFEAEPPETLEALTDYCVGTSATLMELSLNMAGYGPYTGAMGGDRGADNGSISDVSRNAGIAWALCGLIRSIPWHTSRARCFLPRNMLMSAGLDWRSMNAPQNRMALPPLVAELADLVADYEKTARHLSAHMPREALAPLRVLAAVRHYLYTLRRVRFDVFDPRLQQKHSAGKTLRMMWAYWRNRV